MTLQPDELRDLSCIAGMMIPPNTEFGVPGADDPAVIAEILRSLGNDLPAVQAALKDVAGLATMSGDQRARLIETIRGGTDLATLERVILQSYYRDDRVVRSLGLEPRPPFPRGHVLEQGDWSLLDPVRARPKMWRDAP